jgi:class 3 adenylate cyclase
MVASLRSSFGRVMCGPAGRVQCRRRGMVARLRAHLSVMQDSPEIRYTRDGSRHIAYQVFGSGSLDLLVFSSTVIPIESMDEEPSLARFHQRLARFSRVIRFDGRGIGMSDPYVPSGTDLVEEWVRDSVAVLDSVGSERAAVLAPRDSSPQGLLLAATHPERVSSLVFINGTARMARAEDYPVGIPQRVLEQFLEVNMDPDAVNRGFDLLAGVAPSVAGDESFRSWWVKAGYRGASPAASRAIQGAYLRADMRPVLPLVRAPALVLHRRDDQIVRVGNGRYLAEHLAEARYVELPGADDLYWVGETDKMLDEIEEFLTGSRGGPEADFVVATVLFTDIVESTSQLAAVGERAWSDLHDRHDEAVRTELRRFGGREVTTTGDGILATFDSPTRALACGRAIRDAAARLGLALRVGLHTGQIQVRGADVGGLAVHIAARVQAQAGPDQVLVTRTLADIVVGSGFALRDAGEHILKGVPGRWTLFSLEGEPASQT